MQEFRIRDYKYTVDDDNSATPIVPNTSIENNTLINSGENVEGKGDNDCKTRSQEMSERNNSSNHHYRYMRIKFTSSADFYGRVTIYNFEVHGTEWAKLRYCKLPKFVTDYYGTFCWKSKLGFFFICHENSVFRKNEVTLLDYHLQFVGQKPLCSRVDSTRMFSRLRKQHQLWTVMTNQIDIDRFVCGTFCWEREDVS